MVLPRQVELIYIYCLGDLSGLFRAYWGNIPLQDTHSWTDHNQPQSRPPSHTITSSSSLYLLIECQAWSHTGQEFRADPHPMRDNDMTDWTPPSSQFPLTGSTDSKGMSKHYDKKTSKPLPSQPLDAVCQPHSFI